MANGFILFFILQDALGPDTVKIDLDLTARHHSSVREALFCVRKEES